MLTDVSHHVQLIVIVWIIFFLNYCCSTTAVVLCVSLAMNQ